MQNPAVGVILGAALATGLCLLASCSEPPTGSLMDAVRDGDADRLRQFMARGGRPVAPDGPAVTPLHIAVINRRHDIAALLLDLGADPNHPGPSSPPFSDTPLQLAACEKTPDLDMVRLLLDHGGNPNLLTSKGWMLSRVIANANVPVVTLLLEHGANPSMSLSDPEWNSPLNTAVVFHNADLVRLLLAHGADPDDGARRRNAPLHVAASKGYVDIMAMLLDAGADIEVRDELGRTPLHEACIGGMDPGIPATLDDGAPVPPRVTGKPAAVKLLLDRGANIEAADSDGNTPLLLAIDDEEWEIVNLLLDTGADPE